MEALAQVRRTLEQNWAEVDKTVQTITSGTVTASLISILDAEARSLALEGERLKAEQRGFQAALQPAETQFDALPFRETLGEFRALAEGADPAKIQKLLRLTVKKMEWQLDGDHVVEFYRLPKSKAGRLAPRLENRLVSNEWSDTPRHTNVEPVILELPFSQNVAFHPHPTRLRIVE